MPFIVSELLGLSVDGFARRLHVSNTLLPDGVETFALHDLPIGTAKVSLRFARRASGASTRIIANKGGVDVVIA